MQLTLSTRLIPLVVILCLLSGGRNRPGQIAFAADSAVDTNAVLKFKHKPHQWSDDFETPEAFPYRWTPYGRLADGTWAQGIEGHWPAKEGHHYARPEWWRLEDGVLRAEHFPDEDHPVGISHPLAGKNLRFRFRVKVEGETVATLRVFGKAVGQFPPEETDNHVTGLDVSTNGLRIWHGARMKIPESEAAPGKQPYRNSVVDVKSEGLQLAPGTWHDVELVFNGKEVTATVDDHAPLILELEIPQPVKRCGIQVAGNGKESGVAWLDDISLEPLEK